MKTLLGIILALCIAPFFARAQAARPPQRGGVFPIWHAGEVKGTAFLIDRKYGWILTAAHVVRLCKLNTYSDEVYLQFDPTLADAPTIALQVLAKGCDFIQSKAGDSTLSDWVVLQVKNPSDLELFEGVAEYAIDPTEDDVQLKSLGTQSPSPRLQLFGYPKYITSVSVKPTWISSFNAGPNGLWTAAAKVFPGNSGGPIVNGDFVVGVTVSEAELPTGPGTMASNLDQLAFIPSYQIAKQASTNSIFGETERVAAIKRELNRGSATALTPTEEYKMQTRLEKLNGIETWRLIQEMRTVPISYSAIFIFRYYNYIRKAPFLVHELLIGLAPEQALKFLQLAKAEADQMNGGLAVAPSKLAALVAIAHEADSLKYSPNKNVASTALAFADTFKGDRYKIGYSGSTDQGYILAPNRVIAIGIPASDEPYPIWTSMTGSVATRVANEKIPFLPGSAKLGTKDLSKIATVAQILKTNSGVKLVVKGHTDSSGGVQINRAVGECRTMAVRQALLQNGVPAGQIQTCTVAETIPTGSTSAEGRYVNFELFTVGCKALPGK